MTLISVPTPSSLHSPPSPGFSHPTGFGVGGLQPGECPRLGLGWEYVPCHITLVPTCCPHLLPSPAGHNTAWESTPNPDRCHGGDRGFCSSFRPSNRPQPECPRQARLGWHCCHILSLAIAFSPGVGVPGFGVSPILPGTIPSSVPRHLPGHILVTAHRDTHSPWSRGTWPRPGEGCRVLV